jgi:ABC-type sugar transport system ATPase subunit
VADPVLTVRSIRKSFGPVQALAGVDLEVYPGEVLGLLGDNGAGKSTLIKILSGVYHPDAGEIRLDGRPVHLTSPEVARQLGIETVFQDLALADHLDVTANVFLGREVVRPGLLGRWLGLLDRREMRRRTAEGLGSLGIDISPYGQRVAGLSGGQRQAVAVARAVLWGSRLILMDEPTAALGVAETALVMDLVRRVSQRGIPVILITHNLPQAFHVCDRLVVLRHGRVAAAAPVRETDTSQVVAWMTGSEVSA